MIVGLRIIQAVCAVYGLAIVVYVFSRLITGHVISPGMIGALLVWAAVGALGMLISAIRGDAR